MEIGINPDQLVTNSNLGELAYLDVVDLPTSSINVTTTQLTVSNPTQSKLITVNDSNVTTTSKINAWVQSKLNNLPDELECEPITINANCTTNGIINIIISSYVFFSGIYNINYIIL